MALQKFSLANNDIHNSRHKMRDACILDALNIVEKKINDTEMKERNV